MNSRVSWNSTFKADTSRFVLLLFDSIIKSKDLFPKSYFYHDLVGNPKRLIDLAEQINLIGVARKFDLNRIEMLYETYEDLIENAELHRNEDLYFNTIYSIIDNLISELLDTSVAEMFELQQEKTIQRACLSSENAANVYMNDTLKQTGVNSFFL